MISGEQVLFLAVFAVFLGFVGYKSNVDVRRAGIQTLDLINSSKFAFASPAMRRTQK